MPEGKKERRNKNAGKWDGGIYKINFERGKTVKPLEKIGETTETGTQVRFLADNTIFETTNYNYETLLHAFDWHLALGVRYCF